MFRSTLLLLPLLSACVGGSPPPEVMDSSYSVVSGLDDEAMYSDFSASGALLVNGASPDYTLNIGDGDAENVLATVHTAAGSALEGLSGAQVQAEFLVFGFSEQRSLLLSDSAGLAYVLDAGFSQDAVNSALGSDRIQLGEAYAQERDSTYDWSYTSLRVLHDGGEAELFPGDVAELEFDGVLWRVAVLTVYDRSARPNAALPGCPVLEDMISYELLRLEAPEGDTLIAPLDGGLEQAHLGCG